MSLSYWPPVCYTKEDIMNTYAVIKSTDISRFATLKAPATAILIYSVLNRYAQDKVSCFPSVATIREALGNAYNTRTIYKGLQYLCKHRFIQRQNHRSKERFTIVSRLAQRTAKAIEKVVKAGEKAIKKAVPDKAHGNARSQPHKRTKEKNLISNNRKQRRNALPLWRTHSNYERFERPAPAVKTKGEEAWASLCMVSHPPDLSKASVAQKEAIIQGILHTGELSWILDVYPDILKT